MSEDKKGETLYEDERGEPYYPQTWKKMAKVGAKRWAQFQKEIKERKQMNEENEKLAKNPEDEKKDSYTAVRIAEASATIMEATAKTEGIGKFATVIKGYVMFVGNIDLPYVLKIFQDQVNDLRGELNDFSAYLNEHQYTKENAEKFPLSTNFDKVVKRYYPTWELGAFVEKITEQLNTLREFTFLLKGYISHNQDEISYVTSDLVEIVKNLIDIFQKFHEYIIKDEEIRAL